MTSHLGVTGRLVPDGNIEINTVHGVAIDENQPEAVADVRVKVLLVLLCSHVMMCKPCRRRHFLKDSCEMGYVESIATIIFQAVSFALLL